MYFESTGGSTWASASVCISSALHSIETAFIEFKSTRAQLDHLVSTAQAENAESALLLLHLPHDFFLR